MSDLIIWGVVAAVIVFALYAVLGKDVGESPDKTFLNDQFGKPKAAAKPEAVADDAPAFTGPAAAGLSKISMADPQFREKDFLDGAKAAYAMILEAYADGDMETLEPLLSEDMFAAYSRAVNQRAGSGLTQTTDMARLISAKIIAADRDGKTGTLSVEYHAEVTSALLNEKGEVVEGDLDMLNSVHEVFTFERVLGSDNPNWVLIGVEEAGEDTLGSAPDFKPTTD